ncbi:hypothetical protein C8D87_1218 [Lentzea atacamensis]|uniref:Sigma-70, region 4 n=1 Tax=Lentzea atacamensis TaxID=531938 RepID=A0ABX9DUD2_9PSEU|nr:sigma-70 family RNA polymerase sigma factor [Lentzea atacamensis]RAS57825.1 hypothetical protein C8D87_1218 [Lentzea atacamensis]
MRDLKDLIEPVLDELRQTPPRPRALQATTLLTSLQEALNEVSQIRISAAREVVAEGETTAKEFAAELGLTPARLSQLLKSGLKPERALFGNGPLTVAIGAKRETRTAGTGGEKIEASAVLSEQVIAAYDMLAATAEAYGLSATREIVPMPGLDLRLNRPNCVAITSPRLLQLVGLILNESSPIVFDSDDRGWFLVDKNTDTRYRSPADEGEAADYAFIGRLPRSDGKGTFLYLAGIHSRGTLGAVHHVTHNVAELYQQTKGQAWSAVIRVEYDPDAMTTILATALVTPIYFGN